MSKDIAVRLGRNIAEARKASGRTQAEVAEKVGIDTVSLSRIERGTVSPSITTLPVQRLWLMILRHCWNPCL